MNTPFGDIPNFNPSNPLDPPGYPGNPIKEEPQTAIQYADINKDNYMDFLKAQAAQGDEAAIEKLVNYYMSEDSAKTARDWTAQREDTQYQRLIADLQKAGVSPYILSGATPGVSSSSGVSYSGSQMTSRANNKDTVRANERTKFLTALLAAMGLIVGAGIRASAM